MNDHFPVVNLGQTHVDDFLSSYLRERVPALLFAGPEGTGKEYTAIDFARRLCCEKKEPCDLAADLCDSCSRAVKLEHPSVHLIYPTPTQGGGEKEEDDEPDIGKVLEEKRQDIFATYTFSKRASLRVARARSMIKRANTKPFGDGYNVFVVVDAHLMREEAQNALLKLVEEPPERCVLIWITHNPDAILYTIRSRCHRIRFFPLKPQVIETVLRDYYEVPEKIARKASVVSQGSLRRAKDIAADYDDEERETAYDVLKNFQGASELWLIDRALSISRGGNRDGVGVFLHEFAAAVRDVMAEDETLFINKDRVTEITRQVGKWDRRRLPDVLDMVISTRDGILKRNLNVDAALVDLFLDIKHL